jgi:hypothetical protein
MLTVFFFFYKLTRRVGRFGWLDLDANLVQELHGLWRNSRRL